MKRELLEDMGYEGAIIFENPDYDEAIVGVDTDGRVVYDFDMMVECLMREDKISREDAIEFVEYNTIRSLDYVGEGAPIVMYRVEV